MSDITTLQGHPNAMAFLLGMFTGINRRYSRNMTGTTSVLGA